MNLDEPKEFYDPHPGFAGAALCIPSKVQRVASELNGNKVSLREAVARIQAVTTGLVEIQEKLKALSLTLTLKSRSQTYFFRIIRFR